MSAIKYILPALLATAAYAAESVDVTKDYQRYLKSVQKTASMASNEEAQKIARNVGLSLVNVTWEDTGRTKNSVWGDNISDVTIQVHTIDPQKPDRIDPFLMPVIRYENYSDKTADLKLSDFYLLVGNENGDDLQKVTLGDYLGNFRTYLSNPDSWKGEESSLLAPRDTHILVSAQHAFLPIPKGDKATFNPVIFNYQSYEDQPAVLAIVATREGTSATIIDYSRDRFEQGPYSTGQRLFFNANGEKASFTGERISDFEVGANANTSEVTSANRKSGLNMVLLIQVPLKNERRSRPSIYAYDFGYGVKAMTEASQFEDAAIGHGQLEGPYSEIDDLKIERDERYPIRVTVQFYHATETAEVSESIFADMRKEIDEIYKNADYVGSLVTESKTGRPTEHTGPYCWARPWWPIFLGQRGLSQEMVVARMDYYYGPYWHFYCVEQKRFEETWQYLAKLQANYR